MDRYFLGIDASTQSLTLILIDYNEGEILYKDSVNYDKDLPQYHTQNGTIPNEDEKIVHSNPLMWIDALEMAFERFKGSGFDLIQVSAISGSGQQHGTVYLDTTFPDILANLDPKKSLSSQIRNSLSRETSPIWMDSSTNNQCEEIRKALGGRARTIEITGSDTFERFSGPQIRKFWQEDKSAYQRTDTIHLVSSFISSILVGKNAPIDHGDGAGMNLMNIETRKWDQRALDATAPNLKNKLPSLTLSHTIVGTISPYFIQKYGFSPKLKVVAWSGDNPNSLIGVGLISKGKVAISLGTSDTYFGYLKNLKVDPKGEGHVFGAPTGDYMSLICYKNGSLAREKIKDVFGLDWDSFSKILVKSKPGNEGKIMLPYFFPEIVPLVLKPQVYRFGFDENDISANIRGIIEAQVLSMRLHSQWIAEHPQEIYATGGASANKEILQIIANVFGVNVKKFDIPDSAALGAAMRAAKSYYTPEEPKLSWEDIAMKFVDKHTINIIHPNMDLHEMYNDLLLLYEKCEDFVLRNKEDPEPLRKEFMVKYFE